MVVNQFPLNALSSMVCKPSGSLIVRSAQHPLNASAPIVFKVLGRDTFDSAVHPLNTPFSIVVTPSGREIFVNDVQPENAELLSFFKLLGSEILDSAVHFSNPVAYCTPSGTLTLVTPVQYDTAPSMPVTGNLPLTVSTASGRTMLPDGTSEFQSKPANAIVPTPFG